MPKFRNGVMVFPLIFAGYETTVHLIANSIVTLLEHPDQLARLRAQPELMESAVEEILRYNGPIQGTKPGYTLEDVTPHGVRIPKGSAVIPLLGAANRDPAVYEPATLEEFIEPHEVVCLVYRDWIAAVAIVKGLQVSRTLKSFRLWLGGECKIIAWVADSASSPVDYPADAAISYQDVIKRIVAVYQRWSDWLWAVLL